MSRKICVVITARPSFSRVRTALLALHQRPDVELQIVLAASALLTRFGEVAPQLEADGLPVSARVYNALEGDTPETSAKTTGLGLMEMASVFSQLAPDIVVTIADRFETIATAIASSYMNITLAHVQGGEVTGNIDEKVRHAITKLADIHLVCSARARDYVIRMGEDQSAVILTGCPSIDLAAEVERSPALDFDPFEKYGGVGATPDLSNGYIVVMQHPVTSEYEASGAHTVETLEAVRALGMPALWFWPNMDSGTDAVAKTIRVYREQDSVPDIHFFRNMASVDFLRLIVNSRCLVGNSSVGMREASYLGVPTVNIGTRQSGRERGRNVIDCDYERGQIEQGVRRQIMHGPYPSDHCYGEGDAGGRIAKALATCPLTTTKRLAYTLPAVAA